MRKRETKVERNDHVQACVDMEMKSVLSDNTILEPMTHSHPSLYVRASYALVSCTAHLELNKKENAPTTSRISVVHLLLGLYPVYRDTNSLVVKSANNNSCSNVSHHGGFNSIVMMFCVSVPFVS